LLILAVLLLSCLASFGLGYLSGERAGQGSGLEIAGSPLVATTSDGMVVASRSGTKYYRLWCAGADRIADANKVWFPDEITARAQGYEPASNCK
jgi:hypothetical protein